jgi:hypothetical protein
VWIPSLGDDVHATQPTSSPGLPGKLGSLYGDELLSPWVVVLEVHITAPQMNYERVITFRVVHALQKP